jgi:hypothetical protein
MLPGALEKTRAEDAPTLLFLRELSGDEREKKAQSLLKQTGSLCTKNSQFLTKHLTKHETGGGSAVGL